MKIQLRIEEKNINVKCKIKTNGLSMVFNLARSLTIDRIVTEDGHPLAYKRREFEEDFFHPFSKLKLKAIHWTNLKSTTTVPSKEGSFISMRD